jgi:isoleucyl-tRNA synthetase
LLFRAIRVEERMAGYRDTLNLPTTDFPMKADLARREPERLAWWKARDAYARLREARRGAPVWILHDGPPYSNNHLHMGTAANKIWKDAAVRAASIRGCDAPYVPGWDNHGMPIEIEVGKEFREKKVQPDRLALRKRCRSYAEEWVGIQREEFVRLGVWGEWDDPYLTMAHGFEAAIIEAFAALAARGFVQRGMRSIHWCPTDRTALAEAEIEYEDDPSPSIHVIFPLRRDPKGVLAGHAEVAALAWTTTPWTLPANLGLMVDPAAMYAVVRANGRRFLLAEARLEAVTAAAGWTAIAVEARFPGAALLDLVFEGPWGGDSRVVDGTPYVSMDDGTGLVHTAPGHGKEDFTVGQRSGLGVSCPVDEGGRFTAGAEPFVGRSVLEVNDDIIAWLRERGRLLAATAIRHSYPHCWRCRRPVIFRATDQWFMIIDHAVDGRAHRDRALDAIDAVRWDPAGSRNRIRESVRGRPDWCLSRQRSWGVGIPAVYCDGCGEPDLHPEVMRRAAALTAEHGSDVWYERPVEEFLPPAFTCRACGKPGPFRKETDILDVWFDSGCTHRAVRATHAALDAAWGRAERERGAVVYFEGPDQHRGWFNSSLMVGVGIAERPPYTDVLTHGWVLDGSGRAMHKSLGNVISPLDVVAKYGADVARWWALATDWRSDVRVGDEILLRVSEAYRKVRNTFRFLLGNLSDFDPAPHALPAERLTAVDRAFLEHLEHRFTRMREAWDGHVFHRAMDALLDLCTVDLSAVYLDVAKDRLYTLHPDHPERRSAQTVLWRALRELATAASPALVFTAEEVWQHHAALLAECSSVHESTWTSASQRAGEPAAWAALLELRDAVNARLEPMRAAKEIAVTGEAEVTVRIPAEHRARIESCVDELPGFLLVAAVRLEPAPPGSGLAVEATKTSWSRCDRCWTYREDVGRVGAAEGLCGRCTAALARREGAAPGA